MGSSKSDGCGRRRARIESGWSIAEWSRCVPDGFAGKHRQCESREPVAGAFSKGLWGNERPIGFQLTRLAEEPSTNHSHPVRAMGARGAGEGSFARQAERGFNAALAWFSSLCAPRDSAAAGSTAYPTRPLATGPISSGQTLKRPQRGHRILALDVIGDAIGCTRVATVTSAAQTLGCNPSVVRQSSALSVSRNWLRRRRKRGEPGERTDNWVRVHGSR